MSADTAPTTGSTTGSPSSWDRRQLRCQLDEAAMQGYFRGERLYGNDLDASQIDAWFADEAEAYAELRHASASAAQGTWSYPYHLYNELHGFRHLPAEKYPTLLSFGGADGQEVEPLLSRVERLIVVEPSETLSRDGQVRGIPATWVRPQPSGKLDLPPDSVDLITCFSVLHHIPNVADVVAEFGRILKPGGVALIREPIVSMGDWRKPRRGLTAHERGIPLGLLLRFAGDAGLVPLKVTRFDHSLVKGVLRKLGISRTSSRFWVKFDATVCRLDPRRTPYHARGLIQKLRPVAAFLVLQKQ